MTQLLAVTVFYAVIVVLAVMTLDGSINPWDVKTADPEFVRRAEEVLATADDHDDWHIGIILAEQDEGFAWEASVLTDTGVVFLEACRSGDTRGFGLVTDPGDLIAWSPAGDVHMVCIDELQVTRKAAA